MEQLNCLRCAYRHEDNGNCTAVGGFCTAVPAAHCRLLQEYLDTGLTPEEVNDLVSVREISPEAEYAINKHADGIIERLDKLLAQTDDDGRLRELAGADKECRVVVLPCKVGDTMIDLTAPEGLNLMKNIRLGIFYECGYGIGFHMGYDTFIDLVAHGRIKPRSGRSAEGVFE